MSLPNEPYSRIERYLARLAGQGVDIPDKPITRIECYLDYLVNHEGGVPASNAGAHNAIFRGKSLGASLTEDQSDSIIAGTFDDLYIGDYWTISGVDYRIAAFDYFYLFGDTAFESHHVVIVPDQRLIASGVKMNDEATTTGGYMGCSLRANTLPTIVTNKIYPAFGETHVLRHRTRLVNSVTDGVPSNSAWTDSICELLTESMVLGRGGFGTQAQRGFNVGEKVAQLPLFGLAPHYVHLRENMWLQDVVSATNFSYVSNYGLPFSAGANQTLPVRPYFCIA